MQRKDCLLDALGLTIGNIFRRKMFTGSQNRAKCTSRLRRSKPAFAMITAIIVMMVIATITMFTLMQTGQTVKRTADLYLYEQAELHTKSAIEYALFIIAKDGCKNNLNLQLPDAANPIYDISINMRYSYDGTGTCNKFATVTTDEQNGSVLMDISVNVTSANTGTDPLRYFRRTIQKL